MTRACSGRPMRSQSSPATKKASAHTSSSNRRFASSCTAHCNHLSTLQQGRRAGSLSRGPREVGESTHLSALEQGRRVGSLLGLGHVGLAAQRIELRRVRDQAHRVRELVDRHI
eukprot:1474758-Rhodomonas_salina.2